MEEKSRKIKFLTFWAINDVLDAERMGKQLEGMKELGFDGAVLQPRFYPGQPEYLSKEYLDILSEVILHAKKLELEIWLYDENGWPSGRADGKVMKQMKDCVCEYLVYENEKVVKKIMHQVNTLSSQAMRIFVELTYDGYRNGLSPEAFEYVTGFFSDEVGFLDGHGVSINYGGVPWCPEISKRYEDQYKENPESKLELLFLEKEGYETFRSRYWEIATDWLGENFYSRINEWCKKHNKKFTAHLKGEENLFFQVSPSGSAFRVLQNVMIPAVDALERYPSNHFYPRIVSSLAKQFGDRECLAEAIGGSGWGLTPKEMEDYVDWLAESGITTFVFHLCQYSENGHAVRDWPPNIPFGVNWRDVFPQLFSKLHQRWDVGVVKENKVLVVAPVRKVLSEFNPKDAMVINEHNGAGTPYTKAGCASMNFEKLVEHLYKGGLEFDVADERIVEAGHIENKYLFIGNQKYETVIISEDCRWIDSKYPKLLMDKNIAHISTDFLWSISGTGINQIMLEENDEKIPYLIKEEEENTGFCISSTDELHSVIVQGHRLECKREGDHFWYDVPSEILKIAKQEMLLHVSYKVMEESKKPFVFLHGNFLVIGLGNWNNLEKQWRFSGKFVLCDKKEKMDCTDLIQNGYPFMREPVTVESKICVTNNRFFLNFTGELYADAVHLWIDEEDRGFVWEEFAEGIAASNGIHLVKLELIPSTYNTYGPHHYYLGDVHLTSPAQYSGEKNFADPDDAPDNTKIKEWHFRKFGIQN